MLRINASKKTLQMVRKCSHAAYITGNDSAKYSATKAIVSTLNKDAVIKVENGDLIAPVVKNFMLPFVGYFKHSSGGNKR